MKPNEASRVIDVIDSRVEGAIASGAKVEHTWGTIAGISEDGRFASAYLYGSSAYISDCFRIPNGLGLTVGQSVRVAMDKGRGDRWVEEAHVPTVTTRFEYDTKNGEVRFGPGTAVGLDSRLYHSGSKALTLDDRAGGDVTLNVIGTLKQSGSPVALSSQIPTSTAGPDADITIDAAGAAGTASTFARAVHGHKVATTAGPGADITVDAAGAAGATGALARVGHGHKLNSVDLGGPLSWKAPVRVATAAALAAYTRTTNTLLANSNGALAAIDGVTMVVNDRVLLKDGASGVDNGIYNIDSLGGTTSKWQMTRTLDASAGGLVAGTTVAVAEGSINADMIFSITTNGSITVNTTAIQWGRTGALPPGAPQRYSLGGTTNTTTISSTDPTYTLLTSHEIAFTPAYVGQEWLLLYTEAADYSANSYAVSHMRVTNTSGTDLTSDSLGYSRSQGTTNYQTHAIMEVWPADAVAERRLRIYATSGSTGTWTSAYTRLIAIPLPNL